MILSDLGASQIRRGGGLSPACALGIDVSGETLRTSVVTRVKTTIRRLLLASGKTSDSRGKTGQALSCPIHMSFGSWEQRLPSWKAEVGFISKTLAAEDTAGRLQERSLMRAANKAISVWHGGKGSTKFVFGVSTPQTRTDPTRPFPQTSHHSSGCSVRVVIPGDGMDHRDLGSEDLIQPGSLVPRICRKPNPLPSFFR